VFSALWDFAWESWRQWFAVQMSKILIVDFQVKLNDVINQWVDAKLFDLLPVEIFCLWVLATKSRLLVGDRLPQSDPPWFTVPPPFNSCFPHTV